MLCRSVHVVGVAGPSIDYPQMIAEHCRQEGLVATAESLPFVSIGELRPAVVKRIRRSLAAAPKGALRVYTSAWAEFFMPEADFSVHFSAYKSWYDHTRMRVIPYPWTNARPESREAVKWSGKPPLIAGFMGTTYSKSRPGRLISRTPAAFKRWVLQGHFLKNPMVLARGMQLSLPLRYVASFPRFEAVAALQRHSTTHGIVFEAIDTAGFPGTKEAVATFADHLLKCTYVLCPRGAENYSFRLYEALKFGRIPVIIDTDMVLPPEVPWQDVALVIPYSRVQDTAALIAEDYRTRTAKQFRERQQLALETSEMLDSEVWLAGVAREIADRVRSSRTIATESSPGTIKSLDSAPVF